MTPDTSDAFQRETPAWFDAAKLGVFVHWNPAAIPGFAPLTRLEDLTEGEDGAAGARAFRRLPYAEMYWNTMLVEGSATERYHAENFGAAPYDAFVDEFRDRMIPAWTPEPLADLIEASGAGYAVLFTMTEDGFLMWPSERPNPRRGHRWQSQRDVVGELGDAISARGLRYGLAYSGGMDWTFSELPMRNWDEVQTIRPQGAEYIEYVDAHWRELINRYRPAVLWNDYSYPRDANVEALLRYYLKHVPDGVINNRWGPEIDVMTPCEPYCDFVTPEYSTEESPDLKWEACRGLGTSFGYNRQESDLTYLSPSELIHTFVDVVARGGNLLINVAPTATGRVPWAQAQRLLALGWWLRLNGEAIYATRPWGRHKGLTSEGLGIRYTQSAQGVYAIVLGTPSRSDVEIDVRLDPGAKAWLLGHSAALDWTQTAAGTRIALPEVLDQQPAVALRLAPADQVRLFDEA